jgi:hypothetical protein
MLTMTLLHNGNIHGLLIRQWQPLQELFSGANVESTGSFQFAVLKICLGDSLFHYFCAIFVHLVVLQGKHLCNKLWFLRESTTVSHMVPKLNEFELFYAG